MEQTPDSTKEKYWSEGERFLVQKMKEMVPELKRELDKIDEAYKDKDPDTDPEAHFSYSADDNMDDWGDYLYLISDHVPEFDALIGHVDYDPKPFAGIKAKKKTIAARQLIDKIVGEVEKEHRIW